MSDTGPLAGLRVLDLSRLLPGPYATMLLADLGAEVIKVESPAKPDYLRGFPPQVEGCNLAFTVLNRNKRSLLLAWERPQGAVALSRLAQSCDVLLESFRSGYLARFGLDAPSLLKQHRGLIYCSLSGYGRGNSRASHDLNCLARTGLGACLAGPDGPVVPQVQLADMSTGMTAAMGIMAALVERTRIGRGRHLDIAMTDGPYAFSMLQAAAGSEPAFNTLTGACPGYRYYRCRDGLWLSVAGLEDGFRDKLCQALGVDSQGWLEPDAPLGLELERVLAGRDRQEWLDLLGPLDVCVEAVLEPEEVEWRVPSRQLQTPSGRPLSTPAGLLDASFPPAGPGRMAPAPGADTRAILGEAGFGADELAALEEAGII